MENSRDSSIDILRCIALLCVILAHVSPPTALFQLRNFDVPMMVFLSGVVFSPERILPLQWSNYWSYVWRRIKRLLVPTWIFLIVFFAILYIVQREWPTEEFILQLLSLKTRWYVWIVRVFLLVAIAAPFIAALAQRLSLKWMGMIGIAILIGFEYFHPVMDDSWLYHIGLTIPYLVFFGLGYLIRSIPKSTQWLLIVAAALVCSIYATRYCQSMGSFQTTNIAKYPPLLYYTSYACVCTMLLWIIRQPITRGLQHLHLASLCSFIGSHTLWIYLWHILFLHLIPTTWNWALLFVSLFTLAVLCTYLQHLLLQRLLVHITNPRTCTNLKLIFEG